MKLLVDINVVLDVVLNRTGALHAAVLLSLLESRADLQGYVAAHSVTVVHYVVARANGKRAASAAVTDLLRVVDVVPLVGLDFSHALALEAAGLNDYEDAVQVAAALKIGADYLVTSDRKHFKGAAPQLPVRTPAELLALLRPGGDPS
jgi:predicted nucleic acid-binding protein